MRNSLAGIPSGGSPPSISLRISAIRSEPTPSNVTTRASAIEASLRSGVGASLRPCGELGQRGDGAPVAVCRGHAEELLEPCGREACVLDARAVLQIHVLACEDAPIRRVVRSGEAFGGFGGGPLGEEDDVRVRGVAAEGMVVYECRELGGLADDCGRVHTEFGGDDPLELTGDHGSSSPAV